MFKRAKHSPKDHAGKKSLVESTIFSGIYWRVVSVTDLICINSDERENESQGNQEKDEEFVNVSHRLKNPAWDKFLVNLRAKSAICVGCGEIFKVLLKDIRLKDLIFCITERKCYMILFISYSFPKMIPLVMILS